MTGSITWWAIIGAIAGALAKFIMPGREGAVMGPIIGATIGAIVVLFVYNMASGRQLV